jgi:biotin transporter BioY
MLIAGLSPSRALFLGALPFVAGELAKAGIAAFLATSKRQSAF